jgi:hypothetical protein
MRQHKIYALYLFLKEQMQGVFSFGLQSMYLVDKSRDFNLLTLNLFFRNINFNNLEPSRIIHWRGDRYRRS